MKAFQSWTRTVILFCTIFIHSSVSAQTAKYQELYGMQRVYKIYNSIYLPKLNAFKMKVDNRVKSENKDFSDLRDEFNENFRELTYPLIAAEGADDSALYRLIRFAKGDDALAVLCEWERKRCVERLEKFSSIDSKTFPDMHGVARVNNIFDAYYAPRIKSLRQQALNIFNSNKKDFSKIALAIDTEFGEWVGYTLRC